MVLMKVYKIKENIELSKRKQEGMQNMFFLLLGLIHDMIVVEVLSNSQLIEKFYERLLQSIKWLGYTLGAIGTNNA